jgi:hypothetical protein
MPKSWILEREHRIPLEHLLLFLTQLRPNYLIIRHQFLNLQHMSLIEDVDRQSQLREVSQFIGQLRVEDPLLSLVLTRLQHGARDDREETVEIRKCMAWSLTFKQGFHVS